MNTARVRQKWIVANRGASSHNVRDPGRGVQFGRWTTLGTTCGPPCAFGGQPSGQAVENIGDGVDTPPVTCTADPHSLWTKISSAGVGVALDGTARSHGRPATATRKRPAPPSRTFG